METLKEPVVCSPIRTMENSTTVVLMLTAGSCGVQPRETTTPIKNGDTVKVSCVTEFQFNCYNRHQTQPFTGYLCFSQPILVEREL